MTKRNSFQLVDREGLRESIENTATQNNHCLFLDSHQNHDTYGQYQYIIAWGARSIVRGSLRDLQIFREKHQDWLFGHLAYDLKNQIEDLESQNPAYLQWSDLQFFVPQTVAILKGEVWSIESWIYEGADDFLSGLSADEIKGPTEDLIFKAQSSKEQYLQDIQAIKRELQYGNIYELNYCTLFESHGDINPLHHFRKLNQRHQVPYGGFYRDETRYLLCFSPERYLRKRGQELISQPIKGTAARHPDPLLDQEQKARLLSSEKERAENVMIVDLVRNDLSRTAKNSSVSVPELFGLYSFKAVHQMISTVRSELDENKYSIEDAIHYSFPMGSMTGAPKISAMKIIDRLEHFRRGLYSGSIGYINPEGDFDFNVVIRSIAFDAEQGYAQVAVGSAITIHADPEAEYEECLLKAEKLIG